MIIVEALSIFLMLSLSILAVKSDIQSGKIPNRLLLPFLAAGCILNVIYYGIFVQDITKDFVVNILLTSVIGLVLFYTHSFAGGDCKLSSVMAILYPGRLYLNISNQIYTLCAAVGFAIFYGYVYLLMVSGIKLILKKKHLQASYVKKSFLSFVKSFAIMTVYISFISLMSIMLGKVGIDSNPWMIRVICLLSVWLIGKNKWMKKPLSVGVMLVIDIVLMFITRVIPITFNPLNYVLAILLLLCRMTISTDLYDEIAVSDIKSGMILSTMSSMLMQNSRVRGLPGISMEDLRNRLSDTEAASIKRWAKSRKVESVTIVRKIPFAIFLAMGYWTYLILGSIFK